MFILEADRYHLFETDTDIFNVKPNVVEQNFNNIRRCLLNQEEFGANCAVNKHTKISEIRLSADRYIGRSLVHSQ